MRSNVPPAGTRFVGLDALRGLAAMGVAVFHFDGTLIPGGYLAVDVFFALSGFVLHRAYADRLERGMSSREFMRLRLIRLYPLYAVGILLGGVFLLQGVMRGSTGNMGLSGLLSGFAFNALMLPSPFSRELYPLNLVSWSLLYELLANLAFATALVRWRGRTMLLVAGGGAAIALLFAGLYYRALGGGDTWNATHMAILRTAFSFTAGVLIGRMKRGHHRPDSVLPLVGCMGWLAIMMIDSGADRLAIDAFAIMVVSPCLVLIGSRFEPSRASAPIAAMLGEVSYALYAVHVPVAHLFQFLGRKTGLATWQLTLPYLVVAVALAWFCMRYFDLPLRAYLGKITKSRAA